MNARKRLNFNRQFWRATKRLPTSPFSRILSGNQKWCNILTPSKGRVPIWNTFFSFVLSVRRIPWAIYFTVSKSPFLKSHKKKTHGSDYWQLIHWNTRSHHHYRGIVWKIQAHKNIILICQEKELMMKITWRKAYGHSIPIVRFE